MACIKSQLDGRLKSNRRPISNHELQLGSPGQFGGMLADINTAHTVPVDPIPQNAQLFHYYAQQIAPLITSLDGIDVPSMHYTSVLPSLMQSRLRPQLAILEANHFLEAKQWQPLDLAETRRMIALKGEIIARINDMISKDFNKTYQEAIQAVLHLALLEYYGGDKEIVMAHIKGLKDMVRLKGIQALHNPLVGPPVTLFDFEIACGYEQAPCIIKSEDTISITTTHCPETFETPIFEVGTPFSAVLKNYYVHYELTTILDEVRLLTSSITNLSTIKSDPDDPFSLQQSSSAISHHASRILHAALNLPSISLGIITPNSSRSDLIHEILRLTIINYTRAIASRLPFSTVVTPALRHQVFLAILEFNLTNWKSIPGLLLWVLLVASPGSGKDQLGKLLRSQETLVVMYIGLKDFAFAVECMRNFSKVQNWISAGNGGAEGLVWKQEGAFDLLN